MHDIRVAGVLRILYYYCVQGVYGIYTDEIRSVLCYTRRGARADRCVVGLMLQRGFGWLSQCGFRTNSNNRSHRGTK